MYRLLIPTLLVVGLILIGRFGVLPAEWSRAPAQESTDQGNDGQHDAHHTAEVASRQSTTDIPGMNGQDWLGSVIRVVDGDTVELEGGPLRPMGFAG